MLGSLIQSLLMSAHRFNAQSFPITRPPPTDSLDLSMTWTSAATRRADWVTGNRARSTHVQYTSCTTAVATSFHMIAGTAGRRFLPHCGASFSGGSFYQLSGPLFPVLLRSLDDTVQKSRAVAACAIETLGLVSMHICICNRENTHNRHLHLAIFPHYEWTEV